jgi:hypothetical protein
MMHAMKCTLCALCALALALVAGCRSTQPQPAATQPAAQASNATKPTTPEACKSCNGIWGKHGLAQVEGCLCRTKDAGKVCKTQKDCESQCVAKEEPDTEIVEKGPPAKGFFLGRCHEFVSYFGCDRLLRNNDFTGSPVLLGELPPKICVD